MQISEKYKKRFAQNKEEVMSMDEYLSGLTTHKEFYASAPERMLKAIGEPALVDTSQDDRLSRIHGNKVIKIYPKFADFYGMESTIERVVSFFKHASQGLEEAKQILYLLGPVGSAKSSLAERLKKLMEEEPIYILDGSPNFESPLGLFTEADAEDLKIPARYLRFPASPWALKRLKEFNGDLSKFKVRKIFPSEAYQRAIAKTEPGDENNQDISTLVGKVNIRQLEHLSQDDPDAYSFSGGLCKANQGLLEFVEMFKAPIKMLHPLLTATQEGNYKGTEAISAIPFSGMILAHSNESEWAAFQGNKNNEAFLDRICIVKVPYCLRVDEEVEIYKKLVRLSNLKDVPCAPGTLEMLARFCVGTRMYVPTNSTIEAKIRVYNGDNIKGVDPDAKSLQEYKDDAGPDEGFAGMSTRQAFKVLSRVYNYDIEEVAANPVHMLHILRESLVNKELFQDEEAIDGALCFVSETLAADYAKELGKDIQTAYLDSYSEFGQALFERYILFADHWIMDRDYRDPKTGTNFNREALNHELEKIEKPAGITNPKDFRQEMVHFALRFRSKNNGQTLKWTAHEKLKEVIEANMFSKTEDLLPVISFSRHKSKDVKSKHEQFVKNMMKQGYTKRQVELVVEWHQRFTKSQ